MKILFITSSSINGGAQKHIRDMFLSLTKMGQELFLAAPEGWLLDELSTYKEKIFPLPSLRKSKKLLETIMDDIQPDITNTFILSGGMIGSLAWKKERYGKLFVTVNNPVLYDGVSFAGEVLFPLFYKWMSRYASAFLVKSDTVRDEVKEVIKGKKPVLSIKNGIDFKKFDKNATYNDIRKNLGIKESEIVITNVAVLNERKGQQYLIEAVVNLRKKYAVHLFLAGEGPFRENLEDCVTKNNASDYVHFLGRRSDVNVVLANSDIFVLPSNHEGLPNSLMEAMAMGLPCVATDVGGVRQLITDSDKGTVVSPKSSSEIATAISNYLDHPELMKDVGEKAYFSMRKNYEQQGVAEELISIYNKF